MTSLLVCPDSGWITCSDACLLVDEPTGVYMQNHLQAIKTYMAFSHAELFGDS